MSRMHHPTDCPARDRWADLRAGRVAPAVLAGLAEHLDRCPACRSTLDGLTDPADELLSGLRDATPDPFEGEPECRAVLSRLHALIPGAAETAPAADPAPERLGEYHLLRLLGSGG